MDRLKVPKMLKKGDTIALISISGGRAGDEDMLDRYKTGKKRLEEIWGVHVITAPNTLAGSQFLYEHPEARAGDLMWALQNPEINGIICMMGGDDSYRVFPYVDIKVIQENPKVFMGEIIGEVPACAEYTKIEWKKINQNEIAWTPNSGYKLIQGRGTTKGSIFGGCAGPLRQIMGTEFFPNRDFFRDCIIMLENGSPYGSPLAGLHELRALDAAGMFQNAAGILTGPLNEEEENVLIRFLKYEARREDIPVLSNVDFVHRTPMTVIPIGATAEINCERASFSILESGVSITA